MQRRQKTLKDSYAFFKKPSTSQFQVPEELSQELSKVLIAKTNHYLKVLNPEHSKDGWLEKVGYSLLGRGEDGRARAMKFLSALEGLNDHEVVGLIYPLLAKENYQKPHELRKEPELSQKYRNRNDLQPLMTPCETPATKSKLDLEGSTLVNEYRQAFYDHFKVKDNKSLAYAVCLSVGVSKEQVDYAVHVYVSKIISASSGHIAGGVSLYELMAAEKLAVQVLSNRELTTVKARVGMEQFDVEQPVKHRF